VVHDYVGHGVGSGARTSRSSARPTRRLTNVTRPSIFGYFSCTVGIRRAERRGPRSPPSRFRAAARSLAASGLVFPSNSGP
jgi:hypothetical protein